MGQLSTEIKNQIQFQGGANYENFQANLFEKIITESQFAQPVMIELGSNDCFYSILFNKLLSKKSSPINICIEVSEKLLNIGRQNVKFSGCKNFNFKHERIGEIDQEYFDMISKSDPNLFGDLSQTSTSIKKIFEEFSLKEVSVLHMDIQGSEIHVLEELKNIDFNIRYMFISTHLESLFGATHQKCIEYLKTIGVELLFNHSSEGGYGDGFIVAKKSCKN